MTGERIRIILTDHHVVQKDFAECLGITPQSLGSMFNSPDVKSGVVEALARFLNLRVADLYGETATAAIDVPATKATETSDSRLIDIIQARDRQIDKCQQQIDRLIEVIESGKVAVQNSDKTRTNS